MDFYIIKERKGPEKKKELEVYPDYQILRSQDLMIRAKSFYAIWNQNVGLWSTDEFDVQRLVDEDLRNYQVKTEGMFEVHRNYLANFSSNSWLRFRNYIAHLSDNHHELDKNVTFLNTKVSKEDYVSKRLSYDLAEGDISAWDDLVSTLYDEEERKKIEWAIGAVITGDSKNIQKFLVFYGDPGKGKSTILNIIQDMFEGYWTSFVSSDLVSSNSSFALEAFKANPLLGIEHDGDLSRVTDNSKLNSLVAHESMEMNEKHKSKYMMRFITLLMVGSNKPVKFTDSRSGLIRRLLDIHPTGKTIPIRKYQALMSQIKFEHGAIAEHCRQVYLEMGKDYYSGYRPIEMMLQTDIFFNFIEASYDILREQDGVSLNHAYELYKNFIAESGIEHALPRYKMREELKSYFNEFHEQYRVDDERIRSYYKGFKADLFKAPTGNPSLQHMFKLVLDEKESLFDKQYADAPAQYAKEDGTPQLYWTYEERTDPKTGKVFIPGPSQVVSTTLKDLDTSKEHYVRLPEHDIVIDFDLKDGNGKKSAELNLEAASKWPSTYSEYSKSGQGIHLHYHYTGDPSRLSRIYADGIEVKVFVGNSSLRRMLSTSNNVPISSLNEGQLPIKEKNVKNEDQIKSERSLRELITRNLNKEIHPGTKPSMDFIHHILEEAYKSDLVYDVTDMKQRIFLFASNSTNQSMYCLKLLQTMKFASEQKLEDVREGEDESAKGKRALNADTEVIFDCEVFPNLIVVCWKYKGADPRTTVSMINPTPQDISKLLSMKLVGYNCRRYDNHILYSILLGKSTYQTYLTSQKIISGVPGALYGAAYNLSYTDIYDFSSAKKSLKKLEIELGIRHMELGLPWDQPVADKDIPRVVKYCKNDVEATDAVRQHLEADFIARQILSELSGLSMNSTTQQHASKIIFGEDRNPQEKFIYTDLSEMFPGYKFDKFARQSTYRGEVVGEGGLVRAKPGMYSNVVLLDIESMHPTSIEELNLFGDEFTKTFSTLKRARLAIKHKDYELARELFGGKLAKYLKDQSQAEELSYALKIVINIVYGLTSAKFDNSFKDPRNIDNIVAKRGALAMMNIRDEIEAAGYNVIHIKTDSIKIPVDPEKEAELIEFVMELGEKYGYTFEHEATYTKFCLVNDAVYIAKARKGRKPEHWVATGAQFAHPYVHKYLFTHEPIEFKDMCETKSVTSAMYLDFPSMYMEEITSETSLDDDTPMALVDLYNPDVHGDDVGNFHRMQFIGKTGSFCPILPGEGGGRLLREKNGKYYAVTGTTGFYWLESEMVEMLKKQKSIDTSYFERLVNEAIETISKFGDFEWFVDSSHVKQGL